MNNNKEIVAIVNPSAGRGLRTGAEPMWVNRLPLDVQPRFADNAEHAEEMAHEASLDGCLMVIAIGGDGTVHQVLNGLMRIP